MDKRITVRSEEAFREAFPERWAAFHDVILDELRDEQARGVPRKIHNRTTKKLRAEQRAQVVVKPRFFGKDKQPVVVDVVAAPRVNST